MKTYIITDSTSEIPQEAAKKINVTVLPLTVHFGDDTYRDGIDLKPEEFFQKLQQSPELPKTSQITPQEFKNCFEEILKDPEAEIYATFISSRLSGTYQSAVIAKEELEDDRIYLSDSLTATGAVGLLIYIAADLRDKGFSASQIKDKIDSLIPRMQIMMAFTTLKYLKAGGRISPTAAAMGGLLKITPIAHFNKDGDIEVMGKVRGRSAAMDYLFARVKETPADLSYPVTFIHSASPESADEIMKRYEENFPLERCLVSSMGPVIGTHAGPGCFGLAYIKQL